MPACPSRWPLRGALAALLGALAAVSFGAEVEMFSPQGEVKGVRQASARFSEPMVPFGDPRLSDPFEIDCAEAGTGRWADSNNWVYDFERDLPAGVRCSFATRGELRTLAGEPVEQNRFAFTTGGPAILEHLPNRWERIDEEQIFLLGLDAPARDESILRHAWCDAKGVGERIPVRLVTGQERRQLLEQRADFVHRFLYALFKDGRSARVAAGDLERGTRAEQLKRGDAADANLVMLRCARRLPESTPMRLVWGAGIESVSGVPASQDQVLEFEVRPAFAAEFSCQRVNADADCLPFAPMRLGFTAPIARASAAKIVLRGAGGKTYKASLPDARDSGEFVHQVSFEGPFPEQARFSLVVPADLRDDAGRRLTNQTRFPLAVKTDVAPPLAKFAARFGILELNADATLPVTLRNLEPEIAGKQWSSHDGGEVPGAVLRIGQADAATIAGWLGRVQAHQSIEWEEGEGDGRPRARHAAAGSLFQEGERVRRIRVPKPNGARAFEVVGIPLRQPGFYVVELASPRLGEALLKGEDPRDAAPVYHVSTAALVTNLAVHFKHGRESSLVWVTALDSGKPVNQAQVSVQDCAGKEYAKGATDARGVLRISAELPNRERLPGCRSDWDRQYMVFARAGKDMSFVMSEWNEGIAAWRFNLPSYDYDGPYIASAVLDRTLLRAGESVHMKLLFRQHTRAGFKFVPAAQLGERIEIRHQGSDDRYEVPVKWDARSSADASWQIPKDAKSGMYRVFVSDGIDVQTGSGQKRQRLAGSFRVEEFRVPLMRAGLEPPAEPTVNAPRLALGVQVSYLAGGGAANLPVRLRSVVQPRQVAIPDYADFTLANGAVREGVQEHGRETWRRGEYALEDGDATPAGAATGPDTRALATLELTLDAGGGAKAELDGIPQKDVPQELLAELEYSDPNGELLTASTRVPIWPAQIVVGLKPDAWALSQDKVKFQALALDVSGKPLEGAPLTVSVYERKTYSHRKRLLGGFYAYESGTQTKRLSTVCEGTSGERGLLFCEFAAPVSGELLVEVRAHDAAGRLAAAHASVWVAGKGEWWFEAGDDDRMDVLPERKRYDPGDKARLQVRMPFRRATALVTVEREGVMDVFVRELSGSAPVVEVPVRGNHAPNVFVSVLAVRGRVAGVQPTALVDLAKPSFKMGVTEIKVGWTAHELNVKVATDRTVYRVRDKVKVDLQVTRATDGKPPPKGAEAIVTAVDEGLLELAPNASWKLLEAMLQQRSIEVHTASAAMQVVGKRHYGRKARPPGGGGGRSSSRELFDTLLFWKARVKLDERGRASVEVPLNDSLTAFRIVAVAHADSGWFGSGHSAIRSTQELMLFSGLPPLMRQQDRLRAGFTVRNASEAPLEVELRASMMPQSHGKRQALLQLDPLRVRLEPGAAQDIGWDIQVPLDAEALHWKVGASARTAAGAPVQDALEVAQTVIAAVPVRTFQATLAQVEQAFELPVERPRDALPGRGGVQVSLQPTLAGELAGVREYMSLYPYTCLEQLASQAVALRDAGRWASLMNSLPSYLDRDGFAKYFPGLGLGSDALTVYLLSIAHEAGWDIPAVSRERMLAALEHFVKGHVLREEAWRTADLSVRRIAALQALARWGRAASDSDLAPIEIQPNLWPTSALIDWLDLLTRAPDLERREARLEEAEQILRARLNFQGTTLTFSTERLDYLWWLMISPDVNANRVILALLDRPKWREDLPRLARGSLGRQHRGHWNTTVANAWGVLALGKFAAQFEREPVGGVTRGALARQERQLDWTSHKDGGMLAFAWPQAPATLDLRHEGGGKPWALVRSLAAIPLGKPLFTGYRIERSVSAVERKTKGRWTRGDVLRVRLELEAQSDMTWVVVNDPVPAGASVLGTGLGRDSQILAAGERKEGWVWPAFEERRFDSFRAYYRFVPKGKWTLEYTVRLNNPGEFVLPPTRVEALYAPEMLGELPNAKVVVGP